MKIMYVGKAEVVDKPVLPGETGGRIARLQGADVPDALAHALLETRDWAVANESFTPAPPKSKDDEAIRAAGFDPAAVKAARAVAREYDPQASAKRAESDPAVANETSPGNSTARDGAA